MSSDFDLCLVEPRVQKVSGGRPYDDALEEW